VRRMVVLQNDAGVVQMKSMIGFKHLGGCSREGVIPAFDSCCDREVFTRILMRNDG
jgi:hypothetical protein